MRKIIYRFSVVALCMIAQQSAAQSISANYSKDQVLRSLIDQADHGKTRGVCVGTKSACAEKEKQAQAQSTPKGFDMLLTFDLNSATLSQEARKNLDVIADALSNEKLRAKKFRVEGHTDARGSDQYNMSLSSDRARSVVAYLEALNVPADRLDAAGFGKNVPRTSNPFDPENRRVELKLVDK